MRSLGIGATERWLIVVMLLMGLGLSVFTSTFLTLPNLFDLLNASSVNIIFGVGLLVVLIAGGIDISFAVAASVVQYLTALRERREEESKKDWAVSRLLLYSNGGVELSPRLL